MPTTKQTTKKIEVTGDIVEEYERIKDAERDRSVLAQDTQPQKILSADRVEDLLGFPVNSEQSLRRTDRIYMTEDNKRLLLIREYGGLDSLKSQNTQPPAVPLPPVPVNVPTNSKEITPAKKTTETTRKSNEKCQENGYNIDFKVLVDDKQRQGASHQIRVQANCADFAPKHLYINGMKFSQNNSK